MRRLFALSCVLFMWFVSPAALAQKLATETFMIPAADSGIQLHVRNKYREGQGKVTPERVVLFVHGATYPSETGFDIDLPGGSWMEYIARQGYDVYFVDVRGYGRSTRPAAMDAPAADNAPFARTSDAVKDVGAAVDFILKRRNIGKLNLLGWSWGTAIMAGYAQDNNDKVEKLVLYAPLWNLKSPPPVSGSGAYRSVTSESARQRSIRGIPADRVEQISPKAWADKWWQGNLATDSVGAKQNPPVVRAPNGVIQDIGEFWGVGKPTWDPAKIKVPTLLILAEWDQDTPLYMALEVFSKLTNTPSKKLVVLGEGTHAIALERNRMNLIEEVQNFLED